MNSNSTPHATHGSGANQAGSFSISMKPPLTYEQQVDLLRSRGLIINDESAAAARLADANYYRLRGYWLTYERGDRFAPGTTFEAIWSTYTFDAELRKLVWSLIEPIEIKARTLFAYHMSHECGPMSHEDPAFFRDRARHAKTMESLARERDRAVRDKVPCVLHNIEKYGALPVWAAVKIMSMGTVSQLYGNLDADSCRAAKAIAADFGMKPFLLRSWLRHLTYVRNICGHHSRLYNRMMTTRPTLIRADAAYDNGKEFPTILVLKRIYGNLWPDAWARAIDDLELIIDAHAGVSLAPMGFPSEWKQVLDGD